jgi:hypothetical protein
MACRKFLDGKLSERRKRSVHVQEVAPECFVEQRAELAVLRERLRGVELYLGVRGRHSDR